MDDAQTQAARDAVAPLEGALLGGALLGGTQYEGAQLEGAQLQSAQPAYVPPDYTIPDPAVSPPVPHDYTLRPPAPVLPPVVPEQASQLRASLRALRQPSSADRAATPGSSVYGRAANSVPESVRGPFDRDALARRFHTIETSVRLPGTTLLLLVVPDPGPPPPDQLLMATAVARLGARVVLLGREMPRSVPSDPRQPVTLPLRKEDPLSREWAMVACGPAKRVAILAQCLPDLSWTSVVTRDALAVQRAATAILERVPFLGLRVPALDES